MPWLIHFPVEAALHWLKKFSGGLEIFRLSFYNYYFKILIAVYY